MQDNSAPTWRVLCTYTGINFLTVPLTDQLQAWHMLCLISAQIRLLTINHVREFCYSFDQAYNPLSRGFFKQKGSYQENYEFLLCRYQQIWNKLSFWIPSLWIKPRVGLLNICYLDSYCTIEFDTTKHLGRPQDFQLTSVWINTNFKKFIGDMRVELLWPKKDQRTSTLSLLRTDY